jgi:hypothetical protein
MSTSRKMSGLPTSKKLSSWVRPGVFDVLARPFRLVSAFRSEDLPTLDRPAPQARRRLEEIYRTRKDLPGPQIEILVAHFASGAAFMAG